MKGKERRGEEREGKGRKTTQGSEQGRFAT